MDDDCVRLPLHGVNKKFSRGGDPGDDLLNLRPPLHLEAVGAVVGDAFGLEQVVKLGHKLQEIHKPDINAAEYEGKKRVKS